MRPNAYIYIYLFIVLGVILCIQVVPFKPLGPMLNCHVLGLGVIVIGLILRYDDVIKNICLYFLHTLRYGLWTVVVACTSCAAAE